MTTNDYFKIHLPPDPRRIRVWKVLAARIQHDIPRDSAVIELGAGYCEFINRIAARERYAIDLSDVVRHYAEPGVRAIVGECTDLKTFTDGSIDVVFASNLFEHLTLDEFQRCLREVWRVLRPNGLLIVLQPNFRYCYRRYFDDYTHSSEVILTDSSLKSWLTLFGFKVIRLIPRFMPYSVKTGPPVWGWLIRLYLISPWKPFAGQMYAVASR